MTETDATVTPIHDEDDDLQFADIYQGEMDTVPEFFRQRRNYIDHVEDKHE